MFAVIEMPIKWDADGKPTDWRYWVKEGDNYLPQVFKTKEAANRYVKALTERRLRERQFESSGPSP